MANYQHIKNHKSYINRVMAKSVYLFILGCFMMIFSADVHE